MFASSAGTTTSSAGTTTVQSSSNFLEVGEVTVDGQWTCVDFTKSFNDPVVIRWSRQR